MEEQPHAADSSSSASQTNWRKEVDELLRRMHSLLFGADAALERGDAAAAQVLVLRLLGFLDSQTLSAYTGPEAAFVAPIRAAASSRLAAASRAGASVSDRAAFELAKKNAGCVFPKQGDVSIEKMKCSKYFQAFHEKSKGNVADQQNSACEKFTIQGGPHIEESPAGIDNEKLSIGASKLMAQSKITSLYGNKFLKANSVSDKNMFKSEGNMSKEFACVENEIRTNQNDNTHPAYLGVEEDKKHCGPLQTSKRKHTGFRSPICEHVNSPLSQDEADAPANGFVTARIKLAMDTVQKHGHNGHQGASVSPQCDNNLSTRNYGVRPSWNSRRGPRGNFVPPIRNNGGSACNAINSRGVAGKNDDSMEDSIKKCLEMLCGPDGELPEKLRNLEPRLIEHVSNEIMDKDPNVRWDDIGRYISF
uniref:FIGL1 N-terminal domain-containing protein n=1 Tax=Aegilops tauschii subsp. strangulata TaxID=200361 RepID=A0A453K3M7_AEGTS